MKKVLIAVGIIVGILLVVMVGINIYTSNRSLKNYDTPTTGLKIPNNQTNQQNNTTLKEQNEKITSFNIGLSEMKTFIDAFDLKQRQDGNYKSLTSRWSSTKQYVEPYYDIDFKTYYINGKTELAIIRIVYDNIGNIVNISLMGMDIKEVSNKYGQELLEDYYLLQYSMGAYLYKLTDNKELRDYYMNKLTDAIDNTGRLLFNEYKNGIKITAGKDANGLLDIEFTLEEYASN